MTLCVYVRVCSLQTLQDKLAKFQPVKDDRDLILESVTEHDLCYHSGLESITDSATDMLPYVDYANIIIPVVPPNSCVETPAPVSLNSSGTKYSPALSDLL